MRNPFDPVLLFRFMAIISIVILVGGGSSTRAVCPTPSLISSLLPRGSHSYVWTPGIEPGPATSSISAGFLGAFWVLGHGDPEIGQGHDNGGFAALTVSGKGWVQQPPGYPATFLTTWAADARIDGCINDTATEPRCSVVMFSDQENGNGYFAVLTAVGIQDAYSFAQENNAPINLVAIPQPVQIGLPTIAPGTVATTIRVDAPSGGGYLDPRCSGMVVIGYRVYAKNSTRGGPTPRDRLRVTGWQQPVGGEGADGTPHALGASTSLTVACQPGEQVHLAASLVFDSGFETPYLSRNSNPIVCSP